MGRINEIRVIIFILKRNAEILAEKKRKEAEKEQQQRNKEKQLAAKVEDRRKSSQNFKIFNFFLSLVICFFSHESSIENLVPHFWTTLK